MISSLEFCRAQIQRCVASLAQCGIYIGTSSWKYPGWRGRLYDDDRYTYRGKFAESRFDKNCLSEYAEVFKTVSVDAAYYRFPDDQVLESLEAQVPEDFLFGLKVTDEITIKNFTNLPRFGSRAGMPNKNFLNAELFTTAFLKPCEKFREQIGIIMFEFSRFHPGDLARGRDFVEALDRFLREIPRGWPYGVEIRNASFLHPDYFAMLTHHGVAHLFNNWAEMPPAGDQMALPGSFTAPHLCGARFLLKPGRKYQEAVELFQPYNRIQDPNPEARAAGAYLIRSGAKAPNGKRTFIYVNNRLEGNALETISAMIEQSGVVA